MQVCISPQTHNDASIPPLRFLQARCPYCRPTNSVKALKDEALKNVNGDTPDEDLGKIDRVATNCSVLAFNRGNFKALQVVENDTVLENREKSFNLHALGMIQEISARCEILQ